MDAQFSYTHEIDSYQMIVIIYGQQTIMRSFDFRGESDGEVMISARRYNAGPVITSETDTIYGSAEDFQVGSTIVVNGYTQLCLFTDQHFAEIEFIST